MINRAVHYFILILTLFLFSCTGQNRTKLSDSDLIESNTDTKDKSIIIKYGESDIISSSLLDKDGNLWFGTTNEGVYKYDGKTFTQLSEGDGLSDNEVWSMIEDRKGNLWFGTGNGLCKYDGKTFTPRAIPWDGGNNIWGDMCNPNIVMTLLEDRSGNIWSGTCGGGAYRYDGQSFTSFLATEGRIQSDSLHHNLIKSILEDREGNIWFSSLTHGGVNRYDGDSFTHFTAKEGLYDDMVFCSIQDGDDNLWFGCIQTIDGGLYRYDGSTFTNFSKEDGLCDNFIFSLFEDRNGRIWVATGKGLCVYDEGGFEFMFQEDEREIHEIRTFVEDTEGRLWFGGRYGGLWRYDGTELVDFTHSKRPK